MGLPYIKHDYNSPLFVLGDQSRPLPQTYDIAANLSSHSFPRSLWSTNQWMSKAVSDGKTFADDRLINVDASDIDHDSKKQLPVFPLPLPLAIQDEDLVRQVFTHSSWYENEKSVDVFGSKEKSRSLEELERVGASILGMFVITWFHEEKSELEPWIASRMKAALVSNATIAHISTLYGLPNHLIADPDLQSSLMARLDVCSAVFEAYIAGVYLSFNASTRKTEGLGLIHNWLKATFEPVAEYYEENIRNRPNKIHSLMKKASGDPLPTNEETLEIDKVSKGITAVIFAYANMYGATIDWKVYTAQALDGTLYEMKLYINGMERGAGVRRSKRAAMDVASYKASKSLGLLG
ncbi:uncharacterized protein L203_106177 [Cryptococcus depauperatus CBS 7841]|uniref:Uncharacterized protein n=1 Tax=Cryptococcus depauperatus CBS 7841 TaxID=1295531 RepID=A0A1E3IVJ6_9TREE|nr:hypothetical protein L203_00888 [Cryptococcus depauperatus CBS 7841]